MNDEVEKIDFEKRWKCIEDNFYKLNCPFCDNDEFNWIEGTADVSYGICRNCEAECDFHYV